MSFRGLWILDGKNNLIFSRRYGNVESRYKKLFETNQSVPSSKALKGNQEEAVLMIGNTKDKPVKEITYKDLPNDDQLVAAFKLNMSKVQSSFRIVLNVDGIFPVVVLEKGDFTLICLPSLQSPKSSDLNGLIDLPEVTLGLSFLKDLHSFVQQIFQEMTFQRELALKLSELNSYLTYTLPFGSRVDCTLNHSKLFFKTPFPDKAPSQKQPSWKPYLHRSGKSQIQFTIREEIRCAQYDLDSTPDVLFLNASIICKAELEGTPDVTLTLIDGRTIESMTALPSSASFIDHFTFHSCVHVADIPPSTPASFIAFSGKVPSNNNTNNNSNNSSPSSTVTSASFASSANSSGYHGNSINSVGGASKKIIFSPPLEPFSLCDFRIKDVNVFPLRGYYQMKEIDERTLRVLVQLKLHDSINNNFEFCTLRMPFSNRGVISHIEITPTVGTVSIAQNKKCLVWNIGQKFTGRHREAALPGTVYFHPDRTEKKPTYRNISETTDAFCVGQTAYVSLHFKINDDSLGKTTIDTNNIIFYPNQKPKITVLREIESDEYLIWNSLGNARMAADPFLST